MTIFEEDGDYEAFERVLGKRLTAREHACWPIT